MPSDNNAYFAEWHRRNPGKRHEYYLKTHPDAKTLDKIKAEAAAKTEKSCSKCKEVKPLAEFCKAKGQRDGCAAECLACLRARTAEWYAAKKRRKLEENPPEILPENCVRCNRCSEVKQRKDFKVNRRICRQCACDYAKDAYHENPQKSHEYHKRWCKDHPEEIKSLRREAYRRSHPTQKTLEEIKANRQAKAERTEKECKKCGALKPIGIFGLNKKTADGRQYQCGDCMAERGRKYYATRREKLSRKAADWIKANPESARHVAHRRRANKRNIPGSHTLQQWLDLCARFQNRCVRCGKSGKMTRDHIVPVSSPNSSNDISNIQPLCYSCNSSKNNRFSVDYRKTPFIGSGQELLFG